MNVKDAIEKSLGQGLTETELSAIEGLAKSTLFLGGDVIVRQFDKNSDLAILLAGRIRVQSPNGDMIAELGPGSVIGEMSLVDDAPRSASVRAVGECTVAIIKSEDFHELMEDNLRVKAVVMTNIARTLATRLRVSLIQLDGLMGH